MPVIKYDSIRFAPVEMDGVKDASKAVVIGKSEGWTDHTLRVFTLKPGGFTPRHSHDWEHFNHVIRGKGRLTLGAEVYELIEKDFAVVPGNTEHQFENPYDEDFQFICIVPNRGEY